jgi:hypothetical protein
LTSSSREDVVLCGISTPFGMLSPARGKIIHVLLTRAPLYRGRSPFSCDLHVLGAPLTFVLSQDQTLQLNLVSSRVYVARRRCRARALALKHGESLRSRAAELADKDLALSLGPTCRRLGALRTSRMHEALKMSVRFSFQGPRERCCSEVGGDKLGDRGVFVKILFDDFVRALPSGSCEPRCRALPRGCPQGKRYSRWGHGQSARTETRALRQPEEPGVYPQGSHREHRVTPPLVRPEGTPSVGVGGAQ